MADSQAERINFVQDTIPEKVKKVVLESKIDGTVSPNLLLVSEGPDDAKKVTITGNYYQTYDRTPTANPIIAFANDEVYLIAGADSRIRNPGNLSAVLNMASGDYNFPANFNFSLEGENAVRANVAAGMTITKVSSDKMGAVHDDIRQINQTLLKLAPRS